MKIELDLSMAKAMLPAMEQRLDDLKLQIEGMGIEAEQLATTIARIKSGDAAKQDTVSGDERKRMPKGESDKIIVGLLKSLRSGEGLSIAEVAKRTGVTYASAYRILSNEEDGRFVSVDNKWSLKV